MIVSKFNCLGNEPGRRGPRGPLTFLSVGIHACNQLPALVICPPRIQSECFHMSLRGRTSIRRRKKKKKQTHNLNQTALRCSPSLPSPGCSGSRYTPHHGQRLTFTLCTTATGPRPSAAAAAAVCVYTVCCGVITPNACISKQSPSLPPRRQSSIISSFHASSFPPITEFLQLDRSVAWRNINKEIQLNSKYLIHAPQF